MRVLVACEFSGRVRDAMSCDLIPTEADGPHYQGDVRDVLSDGWDLMIAHPPCTYLAVSGARWWGKRRREQADAIAFVRLLMKAPIPRIAIENPVGILTRVIGKPTQIIQPWWFGHHQTKATCLWLQGLPDLRPSNVYLGDTVIGVHQYMPLHFEPGTSKRHWRSVTYQGIANAMADQWGGLV